MASTDNLALDTEISQFVFDASPVALWLEDFTGVGELLAEIRSSGVEDIQSTLMDDEIMLKKVIGQIEILAVNTAAVRLAGADSAADLIGSLPAELINRDAASSLVAQIDAVWKGLESVDVELTQDLFTGAPIDCVLHWSVPTTEGVADLGRVVVAITDITGRKNEERRMAVLYEEIERSNTELVTTLEELQNTQTQLLQAHRLESIGELAAGIAHEINTPIQYVGDNVRFIRDAFNDLLEGPLQSLMRLREAAAGAGLDEAVADLDAARDKADSDFIAEEVPTAAEQALSGIGRVAEIVRALKDFAHPGSDEPTPVDLNQAVESTLSVSANEWKYVADIETNLDPNLAAVPALSGPLNQAILNIVINAAHAIADKTGEEPADSAKGKITIQTRSVEDPEFGVVWAEIRISDTGGGIPEKVQDKIFDPFFTTKDVGKGSGQGLAIAHSVICDRHSGSLAFETEDGVGTTFVIRIPYQISEMAA